MVGHLLEFHPAITRLQQMIDEGHLGRIEYIYSNRLNLGKVRREENALWSFAPHDISVILLLLKQMPIQVIECIESRKTPKTDGHDAWRVLKVMEASQRSLSMNGEPVQLETARSLEVVRV
jgi:predicted dehydrogenase